MLVDDGQYHLRLHVQTCFGQLKREAVTVCGLHQSGPQMTVNFDRCSAAPMIRSVNFSSINAITRSTSG